MSPSPPNDPGQIFGLSDASKDALLKRIAERRAAAPPEPPVASRPSDGPQPPTRRNTLPRFDQHPALRRLQLQKVAAERLGIANPYFRTHEGIAGSTTRIAGREYLNFASYNYLDLSGHPQVSQAAKDAIDQYGTSASGSRPISGERPIQRELERGLADLHRVDDAVVFVSGHATNVGTLAALFGPGDLILHDALIHDSVIQGAKLSGAQRRPFAHNDWQACEAILAAERDASERTVIVVEGVYSMDGDIPDLPRFIELRERYQAFLMVDEAHSIGVLGETGGGVREHFGLRGDDVDIWMGTLSKAFASCGGYIAGDRTLVEFLRWSAPGFFYSVAMPPAAAAAALAALRIMQAEPERVAQLADRARTFVATAKAASLDTRNSVGCGVVSVAVGSSIRTARVAAALFERGLNVQPIIHPAVEEGTARLRFFITSAHTDEQIHRAIEMVAEELERTPAQDTPTEPLRGAIELGRQIGLIPAQPPDAE